MVDIRLFGSKARGDATADSDIDVLVIVTPDAERIRLATAVSDIAFDVNRAHAVFISPVVVSSGDLQDEIYRETPFLRAVYTEGVPL